MTSFRNEESECVPKGVHRMKYSLQCCSTLIQFGIWVMCWCTRRKRIEEKEERQRKRMREEEGGKSGEEAKKGETDKREEMRRDKKGQEGTRKDEKR